MCRNIASGLKHLHNLQIIHRNLSPANVLIIREENKLVAKISSMGISKQLSGNELELSFDHTAFDEPDWQSLEQIKNVKDATFAGDMFRLGCVFSYAVTGEHPFGPASERKTKILGNSRVAADQIKNDELSHLISRLLESVPARRYSLFSNSLEKPYF